jgi:hypothetical protein
MACVPCPVVQCCMLGELHEQSQRQSGCAYHRICIPCHFRSPAERYPSADHGIGAARPRRVVTQLASDGVACYQCFFSTTFIYIQMRPSLSCGLALTRLICRSKRYSIYTPSPRVRAAGWCVEGDQSLLTGQLGTKHGEWALFTFSTPMRASAIARTVLLCP